MRKGLYNIFILLIFLVACRKEANIKLPEVKNYPVLYCYICPGDSFVRLKLTSSQPIYTNKTGNIYDPIKDADVKISSTQGTGQLVYNSFIGLYEMQTNAYPIVMGQTYKINVTLSNGETAEAEAQVPSSIVPISDVNVETIQEQWGERYLFKTQFNDPAGVNNYYRVAMTSGVVYSFQTDTFFNDMGIIGLLRDTEHDGESLKVTTEYYYPGDSTTITDVYLYNCNYAYYQFHSSLQNYQGDNPFAEPVLTYSNVKRGLGCFGAYTKSKFRYKK